MKPLEQPKEHRITGCASINPALGKFLSVDPLTKYYPFYTPYQFAGNKPIRFIDVDGMEEGEREWENKRSYTTEKIKASIGVPKLPTGIDFSNPEEGRKFTEENDRRSKNLQNSIKTVDAYTEGIGGFAIVPLETGGDVLATGYYAWKGDYTNAKLSAAAIFIPFVSGSIIRMGAPLVKGSIKVLENGNTVLKDAFKVGNYGYKGTAQYKAVINEFKKGGNFVVSSEDEAVNLLKEAFPDMAQEAAHNSSKYGYRIDREVKYTNSNGLPNGHTGTHINYYDKENGVKGSITIGQ